MRKLVAYELLSLDGVAERPDAFFMDWDEQMGKNLERVISSQDTVLLGRKTYDEWAQYWHDKSDLFGTFINKTLKLVATSTPLGYAWANSAVLKGDLAECIRDLKRQPGGDIGLHGSIALTQSLLEMGLVDELRLVVAPCLRMHGRRLFERARAARLSMIRNAISPSGYLLIDYRIDPGPEPT